MFVFGTRLLFTPCIPVQTTSPNYPPAANLGWMTLCRWIMPSSFFVGASSSFIHCLAALDLGTGVEQPFGFLIVQNRQAMQSTGRSMGWTLEDNMVDGLFFCATLTGRRGRHTPFVQTGAETSDTGAEAVKPHPGCSRKGHSGVSALSAMKMRSLVWLFAHPAFHW